MSRDAGGSRQRFCPPFCRLFSAQSRSRRYRVRERAAAQSNGRHGLSRGCYLLSTTFIPISIENIMIVISTRRTGWKFTTGVVVQTIQDASAELFAADNFAGTLGGSPDRTGGRDPVHSG